MSPQHNNSGTFTLILSLQTSHVTRQHSIKILSVYLENHRLAGEKPTIGPHQELYHHHTLFFKYTLILSSHLYKGLLNHLFPPCFPTKTVCNFLISPMHDPCTTYLVPLDLITLIIFSDEQIMKILIMLFSLYSSYDC